KPASAYPKHLDICLSPFPKAVRSAVVSLMSLPQRDHVFVNHMFRQFINHSAPGPDRTGCRSCFTLVRLCLRGDLAEPLSARCHFPGRRYLEDIEHGPDAVDPVVPERGLPGVPAANCSEPGRVAVQVGQDA